MLRVRDHRKEDELNNLTGCFEFQLLMNKDVDV